MARSLLFRIPMRAIRTALVLCGLAGMAVVGCDSTDEVTNRITCGDVCDRYAECFDSDYDVGACVERCEDQTTPDEEKEAELEECEACIDDESCTAAVFECTTECAQFVP
jgi:hypothetical protein